MLSVRQIARQRVLVIGFFVFKIMSKNNRDFKGVWIPKEIYLAEDLSWSEKILLIEIDSLDNDEEKGCFASNQYFADFLKVKPMSVSNMIAKLKEKGFLKQIHFDGRNRGLRLSFKLTEPPQKSGIRLHKKMNQTPQKNGSEPPQKSGHNNTYKEYLNNTVKGDAQEHAVIANEELSAAQTFTEVFGVVLPFHTQDILDSENIAALDIWRQLLTDAKAGMTQPQLENSNYVCRKVEFALKDYRREINRIQAKGDKNNGQFKTARQISNETIISNYDFIEKFTALAEQHKPDIYGEVDEIYNLLN